MIYNTTIIDKIIIYLINYYEVEIASWLLRTYIGYRDQNNLKSASKHCDQSQVLLVIAMISLKKLQASIVRQ